MLCAGRVNVWTKIKAFLYNKDMKRLLLALFLFVPVFAFSFSNRDLPRLSEFRLWGDHILYKTPDFSEEAEWHKTFNHEGGLAKGKAFVLSRTDS